MATTGSTQPQLRELLLDLAQQDANLADRAQAALLEAANQYFSSKPYVSSAGERSRPGISEDRAATRRLGEKVAELQNAIAALSVHARLNLGRTLGAPLGSLTVGLDSVSRVVPEALQRLKAEKDKTPDHHLNVWAYEVALVLDEVLSIPPTATRESESGQHARRGAAYARLLRQAHRLISNRSLDIGRLIDAGLALFNDPKGNTVK